MQTGPEIGVASTKAFTCQLATLASPGGLGLEVTRTLVRTSYLVVLTVMLAFVAVRGSRLLVQPEVRPFLPEPDAPATPSMRMPTAVSGGLACQRRPIGTSRLPGLQCQYVTASDASVGP